jgi:hypothetical protein
MIGLQQLAKRSLKSSLTHVKIREKRTKMRREMKRDLMENFGKQLRRAEEVAEMSLPLEDGKVFEERSREGKDRREERRDSRDEFAL